MSTEEKPEAETVVADSRLHWLWSFFSLFGIIVSPGKKHPVRLSLLFFIWIGAGFLLSIAGSIGIYSYSTTPGFCNNCHIMEPYYTAWKSSKHYGKANCVDCHYPPARSLKEHLWHKFQASSQVIKYVTRTYSSKPFAEIEDASCLRSGCHSTRLLEGRVISEKKIKFDHRPHLMEPRKERRLRCVSCHSQIVVGQHVEVIYSTCYLCHFRKNDPPKTEETNGGCLSCHELPTQSFQVGNMVYRHRDFVTERGIACQNCHLDVVQGEGKAKPDRCVTCHNQPEKLARYDDTPFMHENHVTKHHIACLHCHEEMRHGMDDTGEGLMPRLNEPTLQASPIEPSHTPTLVFNCSYCHDKKHAGQLEMYSGKVASLGLPELPSPMFQAQVDCIGCHSRETTDAEDQEFKGYTIAASPHACVKCHGATFEGIFKTTRTELETTVSKLEAKRDTIQKMLESPAMNLSPTDQDKLKESLQQATRWLRFVRLSRGDHNIYLAAIALRKTDQVLAEAETKLGLPVTDLSSLPLLSGRFCAEMCHQQLGVQVPKESVIAFGKTMPHLMHTTMMSCVSCHDLGSHKTAPLQPDVKTKVCAGCHGENF